ncbi:DUF6293 family protein [Methanonatronarchaeum sp. AMET6-2]|uniref:HFX_2341 family transcriptional regulator domain-containing protein n=1 Tax=Methanonatronarchaeum sp. AMET6-2 TaxID=2933293 RepID=UPI0011FD89D7|nr:DUF6293 family protein [Methanonatronarchaeum sp. AMET6-2]RZN60467.1 MAG: hypothetical protein EF811_06540 [Methanonatronarchaeia archaeon]UOY09926.1 DUF6293 family protein [Methanonatronarchaeum sp. AMET6-2]
MYKQKNINIFTLTSITKVVGIEEIVHITPLGFEVDRVLQPLKKYPANRVHILTVDSEKHGHELYKKQKKYTNKVERKLEKLDIEPLVHDTDIFSLLDVMDETSRLIKQEKNRGSRVYVNISGAGRLTAVASTLTGMYHDVKTYYVKADRYPSNEKEKIEHGLSIVEKTEVEEITSLNFKKPCEEAVSVLKLIEEGPQKTDEILNHLSKEHERYSFDGRYCDLERKEKQKLIMRLNRGILDKLERNGYITREKTGRRNIIRCTETGRYIAKIS